MALNKCKAKTIGLFAGNRAGKSANIAMQYVQRIIGKHPISEKNRLAKAIRCMSPTKPESESDENNAQYVELLKLLPPELIEKRPTARSATLVVKRPLGLSSPKTMIEFCSSQQELQNLGGVDRSSVWYDEEAPRRYREECKMRLIQEDGDEIFSLTPINHITYTFTEIWQNASVIVRTPTIASKFNLPKVELRNTGHDIFCIQMATDDNPILSKEAIEAAFNDISDPDELAIRRYGVFKQISGRVFKTYDPAYCYIPFSRYFPQGIPEKWVHARGIDYHESRTPWSIGWLSASPEDEWFLWKEFHPAIDGTNAYTTHEIAKAIMRKSEDYYYTINLIDPLANKKQANTGFSATEDLNRYCNQFYQEYRIGTPTFWQGWDTKGTRGRDEVSRRFKNAVRCGKPFNNLVMEKGRANRLPTLWICDTAPKFHRSVLNWTYGEYATESTKAMNDPKAVPMQKNSHDNMVLEGLAKDGRLQNASHLMKDPARQMNRSFSATGRVGR